MNKLKYLVSLILHIEHSELIYFVRTFMHTYVSLLRSYVQWHHYKNSSAGFEAKLIKTRMNKHNMTEKSCAQKKKLCSCMLTKRFMDKCHTMWLLFAILYFTKFMVCCMLVRKENWRYLCNYKICVFYHAISSNQ